MERGGGRHPLRYVTVADLLHPKILRDKAHDLSRATVYTAAHRDLKAFCRHHRRRRRRHITSERSILCYPSIMPRRLANFSETKKKGHTDTERSSVLAV